MSKLWQLIQAHLDDYGVREAEFARRMGTSPQTLNSWKNRGLKQLPEQWLLVAAAREARTTYRAVIFAALEDVGYWPESLAQGKAVDQLKERDGHGRKSAPTKRVTRVRGRHLGAARDGSPRQQPAPPRD